MSKSKGTPDSVKDLVGKKSDPVFVTPQGWINAKELYDRNTKSYNYLVDKLLLKSGISTIYGVEDTGKSLLALNLLLCITGKTKFIGRNVNREHRHCLLVSTEDQEEDIEVRLNAMVNNDRYYNRDSLKYLHTRYTSEKLIDVLKEFLGRQKVDLVVLDCFGDLFPGDLRQLNQSRVWLQEYFNLTSEYKFHLLFVHHAKKESSEKIPHSRNCSGVGLSAKGRTAIEFRKDPEDLDKRHVCIVKANHLAEEHKQDSIEVEFDNGNFKTTGRGKQFDLLVVTPDQKKTLMNNVVELDLQGKTQKAIAEKLGISQAGVSRHLKRYEYEQKYRSDGDKK